MTTVESGIHPIVQSEQLGEAWEVSPGKCKPGHRLFQVSRPNLAAPLVKERIHFLAFIMLSAFLQRRVNENCSSFFMGRVPL
jgi:hypothetical protein